MTKSLAPFRFLLIALSGWMSQQHLRLIDYLRQENRVLRERLGQRRLRFNDDGNPYSPTLLERGNE